MLFYISCMVQAAAVNTDTPIIVVLIHGGPLDVSWLEESPRIDAILSAWHPGQVSFPLDLLAAGLQNRTHAVNATRLRAKPLPKESCRSFCIWYGVRWSAHNRTLPVPSPDDACSCASLFTSWCNEQNDLSQHCLPYS